MRRRDAALWMAAMALGSTRMAAAAMHRGPEAGARAHGDDRGAVRFGVTAVILQDQARFLRRWSGYLQDKLGRPVHFVRRRSYAEVSELLNQGALDLAWVCGAPYVRNRPRWRLVAVPVHRGRPLYRSYLIVRAGVSRYRGYADLRGAVFAYCDPDSNSGYLVPQFELVRRGLSPATLFRRTFFTWAHHDTIRAVAVGLADAGAVDGYIWDTVRALEPELALATRVIARSDWYGFPPIVAPASTPSGTGAALTRVLTGMHTNGEGRSLLEAMNLDRFSPGSPELYAGIERIMARVDERLAQASERAGRSQL